MVAKQLTFGLLFAHLICTEAYGMASPQPACMPDAHRIHASSAMALIRLGFQNNPKGFSLTSLINETLYRINIESFGDEESGQFFQMNVFENGKLVHSGATPELDECDLATLLDLFDKLCKSAQQKQQ